MSCDLPLVSCNLLIQPHMQLSEVRSGQACRGRLRLCCLLLRLGRLLLRLSQSLLSTGQLAHRLCTALGSGGLGCPALA